MTLALTETEAALVEVGRYLRAHDYAFTTITPESHRRVNARSTTEARTLRDVFGWSRPFARSLLEPTLLDLLARAEVMAPSGDQLVSRVRFSTLGAGLYAHSAYPTTDGNAVFFGPDTYRFCALLARDVGRAKRVVDVGCGSGVGAISLADRVERIVLADINERALGFARINAHIAGIADRVEIVQGDLYANVAGDVDLIVANPPYLVDSAHRVYRDGGGAYGIDLGVRMVREGLARLAPGGRLILYTGAPIVAGEDLVRAAVVPLATQRGAKWAYEELDPDVFGEELETAAYAEVDRIAAVAASFTLH